MPQTQTVRVKALRSFASGRVDGTMVGYQPGLEYDIPEGIANDWVKAALVKPVDEDTSATKPETPAAPTSTPSTSSETVDKRTTSSSSKTSKS